MMGENSIREGSVQMFRDLQVLQSKAVCAANVHGGKACPKRAFSDSFKEDSASKCEGHCLAPHKGGIADRAGELGRSDVLAWVRAQYQRGLPEA
eukprot:1161352-Pelagomonas_calceolata.AAC.2